MNPQMPSQAGILRRCEARSPGLNHALMLCGSDATLLEGPARIFHAWIINRDKYVKTAAGPYAVDSIFAQRGFFISNPLVQSGPIAANSDIFIAALVAGIAHDSEREILGIDQQPDRLLRAGGNRRGYKTRTKRHGRTHNGSQRPQVTNARPARVTVQSDRPSGAVRTDHPLFPYTSIMLFLKPSALLSLVFLCLLCSLANGQPLEVAGGELQVEWRGHYTNAERVKLQRWLRHASYTAATLYGHLPRSPIRVVLERSDRGRGAVPYAQVIRGSRQGVRFSLNPGFPLRAFIDDWTAVHELVHLYIPYPGDSGIWLSEGLATYYQNLLRARVGILTPQLAWQKLSEGFQRGLADDQFDAMTLEEVSAAMWDTGSYMRVYWSGTAFFLEADMQLRLDSNNRLSLDTVLERFVACCREQTEPGNAEQLISALDQAHGSQLFSQLYRRYARLRGMPDYAALLTRLGVEQTGNNTRLTPVEPQLAAIRSGMMQSSTSSQRAAERAARALSAP